MKLIARRRQADSAEFHARLARAELGERSSGIRRCWAEHRESLTVGAGVASGAIAALLPLRAWSRIGALLFGAGALVLRSPLGGVLIGGVLQARRSQSSEERQESAGS